MASWRTRSLFSEDEKLAFELADATVGLPAEISDDLFERLRRHYTTEQLVELAAICALENFRSRFNRVFRVEPNGVYCVIPQPALP